MLSRIVASLAGLVLVLGAGSAPASAQSAPGSNAWAPGPAAVTGDAASLAGVIDTPATNATLTAANVVVTGWFVDQTAQGWAGADDVEVLLGAMNAGGRPLAHAAFAQNRPDVATALRNPFWAASGWTATVPLASLTPGPNTLSVYVHTPARGWWYRQVAVTARARPTPTPSSVAAGTPTPTPTPAPAPNLGYDISFPQCVTGAEPVSPAFAIVGVTGGTAFSGNPCLPRQYVWALSAASNTQPRIGFYLNTGNPGPGASSHWPAAGTSAPRACDGTWSTDCAYDYGWQATQDALVRATRVAGSTATQGSPWWLDVETANSWAPETATNVAAIEGSVAALTAAGVATVGIYSTGTMWAAIVGGDAANSLAFAGLLNWVPGPQGLAEAPAWCARTVTGGRVKFVQFPTNGFDTDLACF